MNVSTDGRNALHAAVSNNHIQVVKYLISMNFPLNIRVKDGITSVAIAAEKGYFEMVQLLYDAKVNINKLSNKGIGPLYKAIEKGHQDVAKFLVEKGAKIVLSKKYRDASPLFLVIKTQNIEMFQLFKEYKVDLLTKTSDGFNPLQYEAMLELTKIMNYLIQRMQNLNEENGSSFTIYSRYLLMKNLEICQKLLDSGVELDDMNIDEDPTNQIANETEKVNSMQFLIMHGAHPRMDIFQKDSNAKTQNKNSKGNDENQQNIEEGSSDDNDENEDNDLESLIEFEKQSTSSSESEVTTDMMGVSGRSFWASEIGSLSPTSKFKSKETFDSQKFIQKLQEESVKNEPNEEESKNKPNNEDIKIENNDNVVNKSQSISNPHSLKNKIMNMIKTNNSEGTSFYNVVRDASEASGSKIFQNAITPNSRDELLTPNKYLKSNNGEGNVT